MSDIDDPISGGGDCVVALEATFGKRVRKHNSYRADRVFGKKFVRSWVELGANVRNS